MPQNSLLIAKNDIGYRKDLYRIFPKEFKECVIGFENTGNFNDSDLFPER
jgi:hypothetical protein